MGLLLKCGDFWRQKYAEHQKFRLSLVAGAIAGCELCDVPQDLEYLARHCSLALHLQFGSNFYESCAACERRLSGWRGKLVKDGLWLFVTIYQQLLQGIKQVVILHVTWTANLRLCCTHRCPAQTSIVWGLGLLDLWNGGLWLLQHCGILWGSWLKIRESE